MMRKDNGPPNTPFDHTPLELRAESREDLQIMSAYLQDAIVPVASLHYNPIQKRFHFMANRFCWEVLHEPSQPAAEPNSDGEPELYRVHTGVTFGHVERVQYFGFDPKRLDVQLNLLAARCCDDLSIIFVFSEQKGLRLELSHLVCHMADIGQRWPTRSLPFHPIIQDAFASL